MNRLEVCWVLLIAGINKRRSRARFALYVIAPVLMVAFALAVTPALAFDETQPGYDGTGHADGCARACHGWDPGAASVCNSCHSSHGSQDGYGAYKGPHGLYTATSAKCEVCHSAHEAAGSIKLLAADTVAGSCNTCHDGTGGRGVYGAIAAQGLAVGAGHRIDTVSVVPGGDELTGGDATGTFTGVDTHLSCDDCHTPHDSGSLTTTFFGDRKRTKNWYSLAHSDVALTNKLLKARPTGAATAALDYGSDWCAACHAGRDSGVVVHNHPVDSLATTSTPYVYRSLPVLVSESPTRDTTIAQLGGRPTSRGSGNRGYLMPYPRSAQQAGHAPICQQCHEDSRDVGSLDASGVATAEQSVITTPDGAIATDNPRFQNFPHETVNAKLLVESNDDLCMNCHPAELLP